MRAAKLDYRGSPARIFLKLALSERRFGVGANVAVWDWTTARFSGGDSCRILRLMVSTIAANLCKAFQAERRIMRFGVMFDFRNPTPWRRPVPALYKAHLDEIARLEELGYD
ncbi:MAG: hypothetical protein ACRELF_30175, partial [Gemmataceae bacterium]